MLVTDKNYYLDEKLMERFDRMVHRQKKNFDHLIIVDGKERLGKTSATMGWAYYLAHQTGAHFDLNNVFFDADELMKFAMNTTRQVIVWDEAVTCSLGAEWQNKTQMKLKKMLMMAGKKNHIYFFLIPRFHLMGEYFVVDRANCLIHIYSDDGYTRGSFAYYNEKSKNRLYFQVKKAKDLTQFKQYTFLGKFTDTMKIIIDVDAYEKKKDLAIIKAYEGTEKVTNKDVKFKEFQYKVAKFFIEYKKEIHIEEFSRYMGIPKRTLYSWQEPKNSVYVGTGPFLQDGSALLYSQNVGGSGEVPREVGVDDIQRGLDEDE